MSATSSAHPDDLFYYHDTNATERERLASQLATTRTALDRARYACSPAYSPLWEFSGHLDIALGIPLTLDDALAAIASMAELDSWIESIANGFLDADSADRYGSSVSDRAIIDALGPADRRSVARAIAPLPKVVASDLLALLATTKDITPGELGDIARAGLERWQSYRNTPPARAGYEPLDRAWETLGDAFDDKDFSHGDARAIIEKLGDARVALLAHGDDSGYNAALIKSLGNDGLIDLADLAAQLVWIARAAGDGPLADEARSFAGLLSSALASATHRLDDDWIEEFIESLLHEDTFDDAALGLFLDGEMSPNAAAAVGQLGIDLLVGESANGDSVNVEKGEGSAWLDGFEEFGTQWRARGSLLIDAAARSPMAAATILADADNVRVLVDDGLGRRDNRFSPQSGPNHDVTGSAVAALIESATVIYASSDPETARTIALDVISAVLEEDYDELIFSDSNPAFGRGLTALGTHYLPEFFINTESNPQGPSIGDTIADGRFIWMGETLTADFLELTTRSTQGVSTLIDAAQLTVTGLLAAALRTDEPVLINRAASIAATVEIAVRESMCEVGEATDDHNRKDNERLDDVLGIGDALADAFIGTPASALGAAIPISKALQDSLVDRAATDNRERAVAESRSLAQRLRELRDTDVAVAYLDYLRRVADGVEEAAPSAELLAQLQRMDQLTNRYLGVEASRRWWKTGEMPDAADDVGSLLSAIRAEPVPNTILERFIAALGDLDPLRSCD